MYKNPNKIFFKKSDYNSLNELYEVISSNIKVIAENKQVINFYRSPIDNNVYVIEFASMDPALNMTLPMWLSPEEVQLINNNRDASSIEVDDDFYTGNSNRGEGGGNFNA